MGAEVGVGGVRQSCALPVLRLVGVTGNESPNGRGATEGCPARVAAGGCHQAAPLSRSHPPPYTMPPWETSLAVRQTPPRLRRKPAVTPKHMSGPPYTPPPPSPLRSLHPPRRRARKPHRARACHPPRLSPRSCVAGAGTACPRPCPCSPTPRARPTLSSSSSYCLHTTPRTTTPPRRTDRQTDRR